MVPLFSEANRCFTPPDGTVDDVSGSSVYHENILHLAKAIEYGMFTLYSSREY